MKPVLVGVLVTGLIVPPCTAHAQGNGARQHVSPAHSQHPSVKATAVKQTAALPKRLGQPAKPVGLVNRTSLGASMPARAPVPVTKVTAGQRITSTPAQPFAAAKIATLLPPRGTIPQGRSASPLKALAPVPPIPQRTANGSVIVPAPPPRHPIPNIPVRNHPPRPINPNDGTGVWNNITGKGINSGNKTLLAERDQALGLAPIDLA